MGTIRFVVLTSEELQLLEEGQIRTEPIGEDVLVLAHESRQDDVVEAVQEQLDIDEVEIA